MSSAFPSQVQEIFADTLEQPPGQRSAFLDRVCADQPDLRREVEALLGAYERAGAYLADPAIKESEQDGVDHDASDAWLGLTIDRYVLRERLGEGGFGVVYRAEQEHPVRRDVALKIIKLGMDTHQVVSRFEAERQTLAVMDHPGIAKVLDAGTTSDGRPYFVMDMVQGEPITDFCDSHRLSVADRLRLFRDVSDAVQHAHQKSVVHRDLKPSNILVSMNNGQPRLKIIDFGIAKVIDAAARHQTSHTIEGQRIGTPEYMSPEQAGYDETGTDIDTRTDIYSLGVLLYRLLTGALPFDPKSVSSPDQFEIHRRIREVDPPKPSTKLRQMSEADSSAEAKRRRAEERSLIRRLRGDLDWITMKAMAKERARRYASANELSDDVQRHLDGEPVLARPPSVRYRAGKFIKRNKVPVTAALVVAMVLLGGVLATSIALFEAQHQRDASQRLAYRTSIAAASAALDADDAARATRNLKDAPASLRGWEWRHLRTRTEQSLRTFDQHDGTIRALAWSPDGTRVVSTGSDGGIHIRNMDSGELVRQIDTLAERISHLSIDPTGRLLFAEQRHRTGDAFHYEVVMRDLTTGRELWRLKNAIAGDHVFSLDGATVAVALRDERSLAWVEARSGRIITRQKTKAKTTATAMTAAGEIAYLTREQSGHGNLETMARDGSRVVHENRSVFSWATFAPTRDRVLWESWTSGRVFVGNLRDGSKRPIPERSGHERRPLAVSPDGRLAAISEGRNILLWDMKRWEIVETLTGHNAMVISATFSRRGDRLVTGDVNGEVRTWAIPPAPSPWFVNKWEYWRRDDAALSADGKTLATVGWSFVRLWDVPSGTIRRIYNAGSLYVQRVAYRPNNNHVAVAGRDHALHVLDVATGEVVLETQYKGNRPVAWTADGQSLLWLDEHGANKVIDAQSGDVRKTLQLPETPIQRMVTTGDQLTTLAWSDESQTAEHDRSTAYLSVWDVQAGQRTQQVVLSETQPTRLAVCHDGELAAVAHADGAVTLWNIAEGHKLWTTKHELGDIHTLAFSRDTTRLALARVDRVALLDTANGKRLVTLRHKVGTVVDLAFTPKDTALIVCGKTHPMIIYDAVKPDRRTVRRRSAMVQGRRLADPLFEQFQARDHVLAHLRGQDDLTTWQRNAAIDYAQARGDHLASLASAGILAIYNGEYGKALRCYRTVQQYRESKAPQWDAVVAVAHYGMGQYEKAKTALNRYINWPKRETDLRIRDWALRAMIEHALGNEDKAHKHWQHARQMIAESESGEPTDRISETVLDEARSVFQSDSHEP